MTRLSKKKLLLLLLTSATVILLVGGLILAAGSPLRRSLVSSGGGFVTQGNMCVNSTIGQPVAGTVNNAITLCSGYQCGAQAAPGRSLVYLPAVTSLGGG